MNIELTISNVGSRVIVCDIVFTDRVGVNVGKGQVFQMSVVVKVVFQCVNVENGEVRVQETVQVSGLSQAMNLSSHPRGQCRERNKKWGEIVNYQLSTALWVV